MNCTPVPRNKCISVLLSFKMYIISIAECYSEQTYLFNKYIFRPQSENSLRELLWKLVEIFDTISLTRADLVLIISLKLSSDTAEKHSALLLLSVDERWKDVISRRTNMIPSTAQKNTSSISPLSLVLISTAPILWPLQEIQLYLSLTTDKHP